MKRTHLLVEKGEDGKNFVNGTISCEVIGEMIDGTKVWERIDDDEDDSQYALIKVSGMYVFVHL